MDAAPDLALLHGLRDIHLPDSVSWWPLAPGWWLLLALSSLLLWFLLRTWRQRGALRRQALKELQLIQDRFEQEGESRQLALELSTLLRRVALVRFPREQVAGLQGEQWLGFLDRSGGFTHFSAGKGRILGSAPYQSADVDEAKSLLQLSADWIRRNT